ncbi:MAG: hypothetical protein ACLP9L_10600 [Thermoguttaceae bacterium]
MGRISKKLGARFKVWASQYRQQMGKLKKSVPIPKDVHDVKSMVAQGYDPLHAIYASVQNISSVFAECVSVLPELKSYYKTVGDAEEEYMPAGPPMSPLTRSYFTTWAFFDFRFGSDHETIGTCLIDLGEQLGLHPSMVEPVRQFQGSHMGIYEQCGMVGGKIGLEELITGRKFSCVCPAGYGGKPGELWYVRLCPPLADLADYHVTMTTPYILTQAAKTDWMAYLNRAMLDMDVRDESRRLHDLLKYGPWTHHWNEFIFQGFHHAQREAIFLAGTPDVKGSLPHASKGER